MASFLRRFRLPIAVALTSVALVAALVGVAALLVPNAVARGAVWSGGPGGPWVGGHGFGGPGFALPPELQGLLDVPPDQRFSHFVGAQINLTDKNNQPLTVNVTPGTVTTASATSLTIAANDGTSKTYTLDDKTIIRSKGTRDGSQATQPTLAQNDKVVVVTLNNNTNATAVMAGDMNGFGPHGPGGPWGRFGPGR